MECGKFLSWRRRSLSCGEKLWRFVSGVERVMIVVKGEGAMSKGKGFIDLLPPVQFVRAASSCTTVVGSGLDSFRMEKVSLRKRMIVVGGVT